jgi:pantoate--beta-alanine ligase
MKIYETIAGIREACTRLRQDCGRHARLGLVPTMGALHEGHLSLVRAAKQQCDLVAVSIFVNPTQFSPGEDFDRYPRTFDRDCELLEREGVDLLFAPSAAEMYPRGEPRAAVDVPEIGSRLDGSSRPGHFRGVATVVTKLFNIVQPDLTFFGQKDAAQIAVLRAMIEDLNIPVRLIVCPTVRESDGLALSSRNRYLTLHERGHALALSAALASTQGLASGGVCNAVELREAVHASLERAPGLDLEYAEVVNPDTLLPLTCVADGALIAVAARAGSTRLIDNVVLPSMHEGNVA